MPADAASAIAGLGLGLSLIVAIGAQNTFLLRQGLRRRHVGAVVLVCVLSDVVLTTAGVGGAGVLLDQHPRAVAVVRVAGAAFLLVYAAQAARRALGPPVADPLGAATSGGLAGALTTGLALTWLNPHVYLDTVVLLGSVGAAHGDTRWWFGVGAAAASALWFTGLGYGARLLRPLFSRPASWAVLDAATFVVMVALALALLAPAW